MNSSRFSETFTTVSRSAGPRHAHMAATRRHKRDARLERFAFFGFLHRDL